MRLLIAALCCVALTSYAQHDDWMAPEGKILNYRTLTWDDFMGKEDKEHAQALASRNLQALAYVCPAIYFTADSGIVGDNGRVKFAFHVKCAFQSRAFVREATKQEHTNYVLTHEQDHYDIALIYANKLQADLSSRDYDANKYEDEIHKLSEDLLEKYHNTQERYDNDVNPEGRDDTAQQYLWDMRIKKAMDNNSDEFFTSALSTVQTVKYLGQTVKRIPGEGDLQFAVRVRPLYSELPGEMMSKVKATNEWTPNIASVIAFYTQRFYDENDNGKALYRTLAYMMIPNGKGTYKRAIIDTFFNAGFPVTIANVFFANADSDQVKELVIMATSVQKDKEANGTMYINKVYDDIGKLVPGKLKRLEAAAAQIEGGFEGQKSGKPFKARNKTEKEVAELLKKQWP